MNKMFSIIRQEYSMQIKRPAVWAVFLVATAFSLLDDYPSAGNLARLEFLNQPAYFVYRTVNFSVLVVVFGLLFLLSGGFGADRKSGVIHIIMASQVSRGQYIMGKLLGGFLSVFTILTVFLMVNTAVYFVAAPFKITLTECAVPFLKAVLFSLFPISLFTGFCCVALPALMDIRLFYLLSAGLFGLNASTVGSAEAMPFYLIASGDLVRLIWVHPKWPSVNMVSAAMNFIFLVGCGLASMLFLFVKRGFWRSE